MIVRTYAQTNIWLIAQTSVRTYVQTDIWLIVRLIVQTSVRTDIQTNIWLIAQTNKQANKGSYTPTNILLNLWTVICLNALMSRHCRLRHLSLCASRTTAVSEKISDCQALPNLSAKLPNISPLFSWWKLNDRTRLLYLREPTHAVVLSLTAVSRTAHHYNIGMNRHRYYESPTVFVQHSRRVPITIFSLSVQMHKRAWQGMSYAAQNKICCTRPLPLHGAGISPKSKYP